MWVLLTTNIILKGNRQKVVVEISAVVFKYVCKGETKVY